MDLRELENAIAEEDVIQLREKMQGILKQKPDYKRACILSIILITSAVISGGVAYFIINHLSKFIVWL